MRNKEDLIGEWSEKIQAFWFGANGCEWVAWKGSNQIFVYPGEKHPAPPQQIIHFPERLENVEDFTEAMYKGTVFNVQYEAVTAYWQK